MSVCVIATGGVENAPYRNTAIITTSPPPDTKRRRSWRAAKDRHLEGAAAASEGDGASLPTSGEREGAAPTAVGRPGERGTPELL
jgi:hypothetical protein